MYHQPSKRRLLMQRIAVYIGMTVTIIVLVAISMLAILGYQFNSNDGRIEQGGLVQFESRPSGANVIIDGMDLGAQTSSKATLSSGSHIIKIEHSGYQEWRKTINVIPGTVLWLNYARLIPHQLNPTKVASLKAASSSATSEDNKWFAVKEDHTTPFVKLANISRDQVVISDMELPVTSYTHPAAGRTQMFIIDKWDPDSRFLLMRHVYDDTKLEWLLVDPANLANTKNITTLLGVNASKVEFSNQNSEILYALVDGTLRRIDMSSATLSGPLVTNIADFSLFESRVSFVTAYDLATRTRSVGYYDEGASKAKIVKNYIDDGTPGLRAGVGKYFDDDYLAVAYGDNVTILKANLPRSDSEKDASTRVSKQFNLPGGARFLSIKTKGRFVVVQSPTAYLVYDQELKKQTTTPVKGGEVLKELDWIDNYMPWSDEDGTLRLYEFDGANQHAIMPVMPGFSVSLSPNGKFLYGINKTNTGAVQLERVQLLL